MSTNEAAERLRQVLRHVQPDEEYSVDEALAHEAAEAAPLNVLRLAKAMKSQHAALMPDAKPMSDELVAAMATDLLARLSEGTDR